MVADAGVAFVFNVNVLPSATNGSATVPKDVGATPVPILANDTVAPNGDESPTTGPPRDRLPP